MNEVTRRLQREAERIAARHPLPEYYVRFKSQTALARKLFFNHPTVLHLREIVRARLTDDMGHGLFHSNRVSLDTAALIHIELEPILMNPNRVERLMMLGLLSGLLHDIRRDEANHAEAGAVEAEAVLKGFPLSKNEVVCICGAIKNHEAFTAHFPCGKPWSQLISDCLYDADKFRWGADTFTHTLWHMVDHQGLTPKALIDKFPWGLTGTTRIIDTFRTATGRLYGPEIIETGLLIGKEIYRYLLMNYRDKIYAE